VNGDGVVSNIRKHLRSHHNKEWKLSCIALKLPNWEAYAVEMEGSDGVVLPVDKDEWTLDGFLERLIKWIVVDDQVKSNCIFSICELTPSSLKELLTVLNSAIYSSIVEGS
jgi:hypothetical protein